MRPRIGVVVLLAALAGIAIWLGLGAYTFAIYHQLTH